MRRNLHTAETLCSNQHCKRVRFKTALRSKAVQKLIHVIGGIFDLLAVPPNNILKFAALLYHPPDDQKTDHCKGQPSGDITIFGSQIAPALGIRRRFAGQEPLDPVTRTYNETMARLLPTYGVEFCEIPRAELDGAPISASRVRALLKERGGVTDAVLELVPECTGAYLLERFGRGEA